MAVACRSTVSSSGPWLLCRPRSAFGANLATGLGSGGHGSIMSCVRDQQIGFRLTVDPQRLGESWSLGDLFSNTWFAVEFQRISILPFALCGCLIRLVDFERFSTIRWRCRRCISISCWKSSEDRSGLFVSNTPGCRCSGFLSLSSVIILVTHI